MPNRSADTVFQLIKSLEKSEKRNFKLYMKRNSGGDLKIVQLFDAMDKMDYYEEATLLKKNKTIQALTRPASRIHASRARRRLTRQVETSL